MNVTEAQKGFFLSIAIKQISSTCIQAYFGSIAGSVPDHCYKANIAIKQVT